MEKKEYKSKQREILANMIQKIKNENDIDINLKTKNEFYHYKRKKKSKDKKHKHNKKNNLNLNNNLSKEMQEIIPQTKINYNYEKSKYTYI